jgi:Arc/MetJ family transcription regulator
MSKRLVDIDEALLEAAQAELETPTIRATVNEALRLVGAKRNEGVRHAFEVLGSSVLFDRSNAWR